MRNLKKILALVLALMMVLSVMVFASAANYDDYSDKDQISEEYAEAVEVLTGMDIVWGVGDNNFAPKDNVARADVATLLYRIVTTDVDGNQVGIYKDYGMFDDVLETNWFAGYVNYAANNELVVGVGDGKFNPKGNVTGYEWITMLLRAIGYDQNNEISGSDWKITAAGLAQKAGILDGFNQSTLNSALTREQVVYLLFNAINVPQVTYTPALGYETDDLFGNVNESIGEENFGLDSRAGADTWGRPGVEWYDSRLAANNVYAFVEEEPVITYYTAVTECDLADDIGLSRNKQYTLYTNGEPNDTQYMVQPLDTVQKIGAEGTLTEVYEDVIVTIDTFLAKVVDVDDATYDVNDHLRTESRIELVVYTTGTANEAQGEYVYQTNGGTNYTYSVGDMVLVNAYTTNTEQTNGSVTVNHIAPVANLNTTAVKATKLVILGTAPAVSGTQTELWYNVPQHTVNGITYDDAKWFRLDQAMYDVTSHTWYFDGHDNVIGVTDEVTQYSYGIIESIQWQNPTLATGYALADIRYMDGQTARVTVSSVDGKTLTYAGDNNNGNFTMTAGTGVSTTWQNNASQCGLHLYRIYTNANGSVALEQVFTDTAPLNGHNYDVSSSAVTLDKAELNELTRARIEAGFAIITGTKATNNSSGTASSSINVNSDTVFLVETDLGITKSYSVVTGYENIADYTQHNDVVVDWVNLDGDAYADYVYVTGTPDTDTNWSMFFLTSDNVRAVPNGVGGIAYYELTGILNGVPNSTIRVNATVLGYVVPTYNNASATSKLNQMFGLYFAGGVATNYISIETSDTPISGMNGYPGYESLSQDYYAATTTAGTVTYDGQVLKVGTAYYNVVGLTPTFGSWSTDMSDKNLYVIYDRTKTVATADGKTAYVAQAVYIVDTADSEQGSGVVIPGANGTLVLTQNSANSVYATYTNNTASSQNVQVVYRYRLVGSATWSTLVTTGSVPVSGNANHVFNAQNIPIGGSTLTYEVQAYTTVNSETIYSNSVYVIA